MNLLNTKQIIKMSLKNKLKIASLATLVSVLPAKENQKNIFLKAYDNLISKEVKSASIEDAIKILNTERYKIKNLPNGYKSSEGIEMEIREIAGIYSGGIKVKKKEKDNSIKYVSHGVYSQLEDPESYERVLENADSNKDKIITREEIKDLKFKVYEESLTGKYENKKNKNK